MWPTWPTALGRPSETCAACALGRATGTAVVVPPAPVNWSPLIGALSGARSESWSLPLVHVFGAVFTDVLPAVWWRVSAGGVTRGPFCLGASSPGLAGRLLIECLLGDSEGVYRSRHPSVENHLGDDLGDLLLAYADVKRPGDMPLDHLGAVPQYHQRRNGAQAAGPQVNGGAVVDLAVDDLVYQQHHLRSKLHHGGGRLRTVVGAVVEHPEFGSGLFQVYFFHDYIKSLVIHRISVSGIRVILVRGLIGTQIRVIVIVFGGHGVHHIAEINYLPSPLAA